MTNSIVEKCIAACQKCIAACNYCISSCLDEKDVNHLSNCIRHNLECVAICTAAVQIMGLNGQLDKEVCKLCIKACEACAEECEKHAEMGMEHCKQCAEACRECAEACKEMLAA